MSSLIDISQEIKKRLDPICSHVYFQPSSNIKMEYPCIIYSRDRIDNTHGNNHVYNQNHRYQVIVLDKDPDSTITEELSKFDKCRFERRYVSDNIYHDVFTLYY